MVKNHKIECTNDPGRLKYRGKSIRVQVDPMGLTKHNIPRAQKTAWRYSWIESGQYSPKEFCDRIYELSLIRRRHGFQMSQFLEQKTSNAIPTGEWTMCCFRQMSANRVFANCPVPAAMNSMYCLEHKESAKNMKLQTGRKMVVFQWESQMHNLVIRGFLNPITRSEHKGNTRSLNMKLEEEWNADCNKIVEGQRIIDEGQGVWEEHCKTGLNLKLIIMIQTHDNS